MSVEAPAPPPWKFLGYKTVAGSKIVQDWYWDQDVEVREELDDHIRNLANLKNHLWVRPGFDRLGDTDGLSEIRWSVNGVTYRIYGCFGVERNEFTFLVGTDKKKNDQRHEKKLAAKRKGEIEAARKKTPGDRSLIHEFLFSGKPS